MYILRYETLFIVEYNLYKCALAIVMMCIVSRIVTVKAMARLSYIALFIVMNVIVCIFADEELYSDRFDNVDIHAILQNDDLREQYYKCFMEIEPCNPEHAALRGIFILDQQRMFLTILKIFKKEQHFRNINLMLVKGLVLFYLLKKCL